MPLSSTDNLWLAKPRDFPVVKHVRTESRLVVCLNVWNDLPALQKTVPTWAEWADLVIIVDGQYGGELSNDGSASYIAEQNDSFLYYRKPNCSQIDKRNTYLQCEDLREGDILFILDATDFLDDKTAIENGTWRDIGDVGWVDVVNVPYYNRPYKQPRLIRWQEGLHYKDRHHWIFDKDGEIFATHQYGGSGYWHSIVDIRLRHVLDLGRPPERAIAKRRERNEQVAIEAVRGHQRDVTVAARESLRIMQIGDTDPATVMARLHSAINTTTPHTCAMARNMEDNPLCGPTQWDINEDHTEVQHLLRTADFVHTHVDYLGLACSGGRPKGTPLIIHHHGTRYRRSPTAADRDDLRWGAALRLVSNFELLSYGADDLIWLPNPVAVSEYHALARLFRRDDEVVIGHSPSKRQLKGTSVFLDVCEALRKKGLRFRVQLIENMKFFDSLVAKAQCHIFFDSFFLGMQCSGLEAAAMGQAVIAGSSDQKAGYSNVLGLSKVPYVEANDGQELSKALEQLIVDDCCRALCVNVTYEFVRDYHDYAAVALRYLDILDDVFSWRRKVA